MSENPFVGTWRLVSCEIRSEDGTVTYPHGENPRGFIMYSADGYVSVNIPSGDRPPFASGDPLNATFEELQAASRFVSYAGPYEVKEDYVLHHMEVSFFPNWVGTTLKRYFEFKNNGNQLILSGNQMSRSIGKAANACIVWERV